MKRKSKTKPTVASPFNTPEFKRLQDKWYRKLIKAGHSDSELMQDENGLYTANEYTNKYPRSADGPPELPFAQVYDNMEHGAPALTSNIIFLHFRLCRIFLSHGTFHDKFHRFLFELYTDGLTYRQIQARVRSRYPKRPRSVETIHRYLRECKKSMLEFHLSHEQGEFLDVVETPRILDPDFNPHTKTRRGKSRHSRRE